MYKRMRTNGPFYLLSILQGLCDRRGLCNLGMRLWSEYVASAVHGDLAYPTAATGFVRA